MGYPNSLFWDALEPTWVNLQYAQEPDDFIYVTDYGTKIICNSGNNGAAANGRIKGVADGSFKLAFKLGYVWGWSNLYVANINAIGNNIATPSNQDYNVSGYNGMFFINNSSNNNLQIGKGVSGTSTLLTNTTGIADSVVINLWRTTDNVVKYRVGSNNVVTVGTMADTWIFYTANQSPCSTTIVTAHNNVRGPS